MVSPSQPHPLSKAIHYYTVGLCYSYTPEGEEGIEPGLHFLLRSGEFGLFIRMSSFGESNKNKVISMRKEDID